MSANEFLPWVRRAAETAPESETGETTVDAAIDTPRDTPRELERRDFLQLLGVGGLGHANSHYSSHRLAEVFRPGIEKGESSIINQY